LRGRRGIDGKGVCGVAGSDRSGAGGAADPDLEIFFLDRKFGEIGAFHQINELFDLF
jgi:hypothetical protein